MKYAKFSDDFLSYFRLDDGGETLVLKDKLGGTRAVKLLPYEERPLGEWIPVSERLPDEDGIYLVTLEYVEDSEIVYETDMAKFVYSEKDDCNTGFHKAYTVIAWRPSPEPYQKEEEKNEDNNRNY